MSKKIMQSVTRELVDSQTGEVISYEQQKVFTEKIDPEKFYMTFFEYAQPIHKLKSQGVARSILDWMCEHAEFNTGRVNLSSAIRQEVCKELSIKPSQLSNNISKLIDLHLIDGDKGSYLLNPQIFWKGDAQSRKELLKDKTLRVSFEII